MELFGKMREFAEYLAKSMTVPARYQNKPADMVTAFLKGQELGLQPISALEAFNFVHNTPCLQADFFLAIIMTHPLYDGHEEMTFSEIEEAGKAVCTFIRKGRRHTAEFSVKDAQRRGHWGQRGNWSTDPWRMLQIRARTFAGRDAFADALKGFTTVEDVEDAHELKKAETSAFKIGGTRAEQVNALTTGGEASPVVEGEFVVETKASKPVDDKRHRAPAAPAKTAKTAKDPEKPRNTQKHPETPDSTKQNHPIKSDVKSHKKTTSAPLKREQAMLLPPDQGLAK